MLTLSQQIIIEQFAAKVVAEIKQVLKTKPLTRKSVRYENGTRKESTFQSPVSASGKLANSVRFELTDTELIIYSDDYIYFSIYGRKPTTNLGSGTLKDKIKKWISDKGIQSDIDKDTLAFLISRKIHREGNSLYLFSGKKNSGLLENIITSQMINEYNSKFTKQLELDIKSEFLKDFGN
ncbi:MAG: hypothetical protein RIR01_567 [Bacteroidota bacterium]|jgi:hypothetical protein